MRAVGWLSSGFCRSSNAAETWGMGGSWERARDFGCRSPLRGERERLGKEKELTGGPRMQAADWACSPQREGERNGFLFFQTNFQSFFQIEF